MVMQRDFLMRMIHRLTEAFLRIVAGKALQDPQQALHEIEDLVADAMGSHPQFVLGQGNEAIDTLQPALAAQVGRLLLLHAQLCDELGHDSARSRAMGFRALQIALKRPEADFSTIAAVQLREHFETLGQVADAPTLALTCLQAHAVHRQRGQFADAEDFLFFALELDAENPGVAITGKTFYDQLEAASDTELLEGGLDPEEVAESRADFEAMQSET